MALARPRVERGIVANQRSLAESERRLDNAEVRAGAGGGAGDVVEEGIDFAWMPQLEDVGVGGASHRAVRVAGHAGPLEKADVARWWLWA